MNLAEKFLFTVVKVIRTEIATVGRITSVGRIATVG
jgi:hypothetical protein